MLAGHASAQIIQPVLKPQMFLYQRGMCFGFTLDRSLRQTPPPPSPLSCICRRYLVMWSFSPSADLLPSSPGIPWDQQYCFFCVFGTCIILMNYLGIKAVPLVIKNDFFNNE